MAQGTSFEARLSVERSRTVNVAFSPQRYTPEGLSISTLYVAPYAVKKRKAAWRQTLHNCRTTFSATAIQNNNALALQTTMQESQNLIKCFHVPFSQFIRDQL